MSVTRWFAGGLVVLPMLAPLAASQAKLTGAWIVEQYGGGAPSIDLVQFDEFVADELISQMDMDKLWPKRGLALDSLEYARAWMHLSPKNSSPTDADFTEDAAIQSWSVLGGGAVTAQQMSGHSGAEWWHIVLELRIKAEGLTLTEVADGRPLNPVVLDEYLSKRHKRTSLKERMALAGTEPYLNRARLEEFHRADLLDRMDANRDGAIDLVELQAGWPLRNGAWGPAAYIAFAKHASNGVLPRSMPAAATPTPLIQWSSQEAGDWLLKWGTSESGEKAISADMLAEILEKQAKNDRPEMNRVFQGSGYLLHPMPVWVDNAWSEPIGRRRLFLRVLQDYKTPGLQAKPATVSWARENAIRTASLDATVGLSFIWDSRNSGEQQVFAAMRVQRQTNSSSTPQRVKDQRDFFLSYVLTVGVSGLKLLRGYQFRVGGLRQDDRATGVERNALVLDWYPSLGTGGLRSGNWNSLRDNGSKALLEYFYAPSMGIEFSDYDVPAGSSISEVPTHVRLELGGGLRLLEKLTLQTDVTVRNDFEGENFGFWTSTFSWPLFGSKSVSLAATYSKGRDAPSFGRSTRSQVGLSVGF